jgi:basic membrane protein A
MIKRVDTTLVYALNAVKNGTFKGEVMTFDLKADGVGYSTTNAKALPQDIVSQIDAEKAKIVAGTVKVAPTLEEAKATPNFPADIKAQ